MTMWLEVARRSHVGAAAEIAQYKTLGRSRRVYRRAHTPCLFFLHLIFIHEQPVSWRRELERFVDRTHLCSLCSARIVAASSRLVRRLNPASLSLVRLEWRHAGVLSCALLPCFGTEEAHGMDAARHRSDSWITSGSYIFVVNDMRFSLMR